MSQLNTSTTNGTGRDMNTIRNILVDRFPVFKPKRMAKLPLKIGIHRDIRRLAPDLTARKVAKALADYT
jgi:sRNA-binding protein